MLYLINIVCFLLFFVETYSLQHQNPIDIRTTTTGPAHTRSPRYTSPVTTVTEKVLFQDYSHGPWTQPEIATHSSIANRYWNGTNKINSTNQSEIVPDKVKVYEQQNNTLCSKGAWGEESNCDHQVPCVPGPVTDLHIEDNINGTPKLQWSPPIKKASCVHKYRIYDGIEKIEEAKPENRSTAIRNTETCVPLIFEVESINAANIFSERRSINYTFLPPNLFRDSSFTEINDTLSFSWNVSAYDKACFNLIQVVICPDNSSQCQTYSAKNSSQIINDKFVIRAGNRKPGVAYNYSISASGTGNLHRRSGKIEPKVPGPVNDLRIKDNINGTPKLQWSPPIKNASCVHKYRIYDGIGKTEETKPENRSVAIMNTEKCVPLTFEVESINAANISSERRSINYTFLPPNLFQDCNFTEINNTLSFSWNVSSYDKACFNLIQVVICSDNSSQCQIYSAKNSSENIKDKFVIWAGNRKPGVAYNYSISASGTGNPHTLSGKIEPKANVRTFEGNKTMLKHLREIAEQVKPNTDRQDDRDLTYSYFKLVKDIPVNSPNITLQYKDKNGPEVTLLKYAADQLSNSNITVVVFKEKTATQSHRFGDNVTVGDIVIVETGTLRNDSQNRVLQIKFQKKEIEKPDDPNWVCVFWDPEMSKWSVRGIKTTPERDFIICSSNHLSTFSILLPNPNGDSFNDMNKEDSMRQIVLTQLSRLGSGITICFLLLLISMNYRKKNENETRKILMSNSIALLLTHITYQIYTLSCIGYLKCLVLTLMKYYFVLAFLLWTAADGINMWRMLLVDVFNTKAYIYYRWYKLISWGVPLITTTIGLLFIDPRDKCELQFGKLYDLIFFAVPWMIILCCNMLLFIWVFLNITCSKRMRRFKLRKVDYILALTQVFGVSWCVILPFLHFDSTQLLTECLLVVVVSTQGLFIFIVRGGIVKNSKTQSKIRSTETLKSPMDSAALTKLLTISTEELDVPSDHSCIYKTSLINRRFD